MNTYEWIDSLSPRDRTLIETAMIYTLTTRAVDGPDPTSTKCVNLTPDGRMCAASRCMTDEARAMVSNTSPVRALFHVAGLRGIDPATLFLPPYRDEKFRLHDTMREAQYLHDTPEHWDETGLTRQGFRDLCVNVEVTR